MINIEHYIKSKLSRGREKQNGDYFCTCPFHRDTSPSFSINLHDGRFHCFSINCGLGGGIVLFYKLMEGCSWKEAFQAVGRTAPPQYADDMFGESDRREPEERLFDPFPPFRTSIAETFPEYLKSRGFTQEDVAPFDLHIGLGSTYRNCVIFPYFDEDAGYVTFIARKMTSDKVDDKYLKSSPSLSDSVLYGEWLFRYVRPKMFLVVEGVFDVMRLWTYGALAVGISGGGCTSAQYMGIVRLADKHNCSVGILLDPETEDASDIMQAELFAQGIEATVGRLEGTDPGDMSGEQFATQVVSTFPEIGECYV